MLFLPLEEEVEYFYCKGSGWEKQVKIFFLHRQLGIGHSAEWLMSEGGMVVGGV